MTLTDQIVVDLESSHNLILLKITGKRTLTDQIVVDLESSHILILLKTYR
jgi:hypothetical protein